MVDLNAIYTLSRLLECFPESKDMARPCRGNRGAEHDPENYTKTATAINDKNLCYGVDSKSDGRY